jgi:hypothetical protein
MSVREFLKGCLEGLIRLKTQHFTLLKIEGSFSSMHTKQTIAWNNLVIFISVPLSINPVLTLISPNVVVEWLTLLIHIREVPGSNIGPETVYPEVFRCFSQTSRKILEEKFKIRALLLPSNFFTIHHSLIDAI